MVQLQVNSQAAQGKAAFGLPPSIVNDTDFFLAPVMIPAVHVARCDRHSVIGTPTIAK